MTWAGITITDQPTDVPADMVAGLLDAANGAGIDLTLEA
jgi:hypothetical protein